MTQPPIVFRMLPKCASMWARRMRLIRCSALTGACRRTRCRSPPVRRRRGHVQPRPLRRPLPVERDRLRLRAAGELPGMPGIHLVKHLRGEVWQRLAGGDRLDDASGRFVATGDVMRRHGDRPRLGRGRLLPVGIGQPLEKSGGLRRLRLQLPGECFPLGFHDVLLGLSFTV